MKVTIIVETGEQDIEITRHRTWLGGNRLQETGKLLNGAAEDVRRALDLAPDSGTLLAAWRQVVGLVGSDLDGSLQSVVDRVAEAVDALGREASREPHGPTTAAVTVQASEGDDAAVADRVRRDVDFDPARSGR